MIGATAQAILSRRSMAAPSAAQQEVCPVLPTSMDAVGTAVAAPLARASDPRTSKQAAANVDCFKAAQEAKIFSAIFEAGEQGATANEIAPRINLTKEQVNRRLSDMGKRNLIHRVLKDNALTSDDFVERGRCAVWWKT